jgi:hypothetical protein
MRRLAATTTLLLLCACNANETPPPTHNPYTSDAGVVLTCVPNDDGQIDADEMQAVLDVAASYLISPAGETRAVDLTGSVNAGGQRVWDWSADAPTDQILTLTATAVTGKWYAASFPTGQFTTPLDSAATLDAVYRQDSDAMYLLGYASKAAGASQTLVVYAAPVALYRFPLVVGKTWTSVGDVTNATVYGLPYAGRDTYETTVVDSGILKLPGITFTQALRVRTHVTAAPAAGASVSKWQVSFLYECFGEIARATSENGETQADFTTAAEVRRYGLE